MGLYEWREDQYNEYVKGFDRKEHAYEKRTIDLSGLRERMLSGSSP